MKAVKWSFKLEHKYSYKHTLMLNGECFFFSTSEDQVGFLKQMAHPDVQV